MSKYIFLSCLSPDPWKCRNVPYPRQSVKQIFKTKTFGFKDIHSRKYNPCVDYSCNVAELGPINGSIHNPGYFEWTWSQPNPPDWGHIDTKSEKNSKDAGEFFPRQEFKYGDIIVRGGSIDYYWGGNEFIAWNKEPLTLYCKGVFIISAYENFRWHMNLTTNTQSKVDGKIVPVVPTKDAYRFDDLLQGPGFVLNEGHVLSSDTIDEINRRRENYEVSVTLIDGGSKGGYLIPFSFPPLEVKPPLTTPGTSVAIQKLDNDTALVTFSASVFNLPFVPFVRISPFIKYFDIKVSYYWD